MHPSQPPAPPADTDWPESLIEVGHVLDAWGTLGWVKIAPDAADAAALLKAPRLWLLPPPGRPAQRRRLDVRLSRRHAQTVVALFDGVADRNGAEALKGWRVHARREDFPPPPQDSYYWVDLIGCRVVNREGVDLGVVEGLLDSGAQAILRLRVEDGGDKSGSDKNNDKPRERLIPFVDAFVGEVDVAARRIVADWLPEYD